MKRPSAPPASRLFLALGPALLLACNGKPAVDLLQKNGWGALALPLPIAAAFAHGHESEMKPASKVTCSLVPATFTTLAGNSHTVTANVTIDGIPRPGLTVTFNVISGPNAGKTGSGVTNASGQAAFTYTSNGAPGTDVIRAGGTVPDSETDFRCTEAAVSWIVRQPRKCEKIWVYSGGGNDDFLEDPNISEPSYASLELQDRIGSHYSNFDQIIPDSRFGHTITFADLAALVDCDKCDIFRATLEIKLRATLGGSGNDSIELEAQGGAFAWGARIASDSTTPGILPGPWSPGRTETLHLNLAALPVNLPSSILSELNDGKLDVYLQDDTGVDYMTLQITTVCDCTEIHGKKFADLNENGMKDPNEDYLQGFTIQLLDESGAPVNTAVTNTDGEYQFTGLSPGTYIVSEEAFQMVPLPSQPSTPLGWHQTFPESGTHVVTLLPGQVAENVNFGDSYIFCGSHYQLWANVIIAQPNTPTYGNLNTPSAELIIGTSGDDKIYGVGGNDCIYGLGGNDIIHGDGEMTINVGKDKIYGGPGDDTVYGDANDDLISGGGGNDYLVGDAGEDEIYGGPGKDKLLGDADRDDLYGGPGNDFLMGDANDDDLYGQDGDDRLCGNAGDDSLDGGPGHDGGRGGGGTDNEILEFTLDSDECTRSAFDAYPL